jgi:hypothetical protein
MHSQALRQHRLLKRSVLRFAKRCDARIVAATSSSQFQFLEKLTKSEGIDWTRVEMFHLDEYIAIPASHPASFRTKVGVSRNHLLDGMLARVSREPNAVYRGTLPLAFSAPDVPHRFPASLWDSSNSLPSACASHRTCLPIAGAVSFWVQTWIS